MPGRRILLGLLAAGALFAFIWFVERKGPTTEGAREARRWALDLPAAEISGVESTGPAGNWAIEKGKTGGWRVVKPVSARADESVVSGILLDVGRIETEGELPVPVDRAALGLEPPVATVRITTAGGVKLVRIGAPIAGIEAVAAQIDGGAPFAARRTLATAAVRPVDELRDRQILATAKSADRIEATAPDGTTWWMEKRGEEWWCGSPGQPEDLVDLLAVRTLLEELASFRVSAFGFAAAAGTVWWRISLRVPGEPLHSIRVDAGTGLAAAQNGRTRLEIDREPVEGATKLPDLLPGNPRSRSLMANLPIAPQRVVAGSAGRTVTWELDPKGVWRVDGKEVDATPLTRAVEIARSANGPRVMPDREVAPLAATNPELTLEVTDTTGKTHRCEVYSIPEGGALWYRRRPSPLVIPSPQLESIRKEFARLFSPAPTAPASGAATPEAPKA